ncbi:MAG: hypothetical protein JW768_12895 [Chitinispirillaceae bacterium]|nr:hypothetical protein [Chitinispirillaceae bacterium]
MILFLHLSASAITTTIGPNKEVLIDGKPFFPIFVWMQNASRIPVTATYGINTFMAQGDNSSALAYCNAARDNNAYAIPSWTSGAATGSVINHPAMLGWVFGDEPDLPDNKIPPSTIRTQYNSIKSSDPGHLTFLTITAGFYSGDKVPDWMKGSDSMYYQYPLYTDAIGFDYYPVYGYCRPDWVYKVGGSQDELVRKYTKNVKSTYQWIECARTSSEWCELSGRGADDGIYDYELKDEVWLAIVKGANAIGYFTHSWECPGSTYTQLCLNESLIAMLKKVNAQITALTDVLCGPDANAAITVSLADSKGRLEFNAKCHDRFVYLIAVNVINLTGARDTQQATFTVPGVAGAISVYDEGRSITPVGNNFADRFTKTDPVHIYVLSGSINATRPFDVNRSRSTARQSSGPGNLPVFTVSGKKISGHRVKPGQVYFYRNGAFFDKMVYVK